MTSLYTSRWISITRLSNPRVGNFTSYTQFSLGWSTTTQGLSFICIQNLSSPCPSLPDSIVVRVTGWLPETWRSRRGDTRSWTSRTSGFLHMKTVPCIVSMVTWFSIPTVVPWNLRNTDPWSSVLLLSGRTVLTNHHWSSTSISTKMCYSFRPYTPLVSVKWTLTVQH